MLVVLEKRPYWLINILMLSNFLVELRFLLHVPPSFVTSATISGNAL